MVNAFYLSLGVLIVLLWLIGERWSLIKGSTKRFLREAGIKRVLTLSVLHSYFYGRWTNQYINLFLNRVMPNIGRRGRKWFANRYHGKVLTHEQAEAVFTINKEIHLREIEHVIPYPIARDFLLKTPLEIAVYECGCRHARRDHCEPTQVCLVIGQPFVDFVLEHNPRSSRKITKEEALEILREEHERGHLHSAWFKDACLDRFYSICNCCKCCCGGIEAMVKYGTPMMASSGYVAFVDKEACRACGVCVEACPFEALFLEENRVSLIWERCMGCGVCVARCKFDAISLVRDETKGEPLDVRIL